MNMNWLHFFRETLNEYQKNPPLSSKKTPSIGSSAGSSKVLNKIIYLIMN